MPSKNKKKNQNQAQNSQQQQQKLTEATLSSAQFAKQEFPSLGEDHGQEETKSNSNASGWDFMGSSTKQTKQTQKAPKQQIVSQSNT